MEEIIIEIPAAVNEPIRDYAPGSPERSSLKSKLVEMENDLNENRNCPFAKGIISYKDLNLEMVGA